MNTCHTCGSPLYAEKKQYCGYCGAPVVRAARARRADGAPGTPSKRSLNLPLFAGGIALALVLIVTLVVVLVRQHPGSTPLAGTPTGTDQGGVVASQATTDEQTFDEPTDEPTDTVEPTESAPPTDPATVVEDYYQAVNNQDFQTAWNLGGKNLGKPYSTWVNGYATTESDVANVTSTDGDTVDVTITAQWNDGTTHYYVGSYVVQDGQIVSGTLQMTSAPG